VYNATFFAKIAMSSMLISASLFAASGKDLAIKLKLNAEDKAMKQWERMFSNPAKLAEMGADKLSAGDQAALKAYLVEFAADGDKPAAAGK